LHPSPTVSPFGEAMGSDVRGSSWTLPRGEQEVRLGESMESRLLVDSLERNDTPKQLSVILAPPMGACDATNCHMAPLSWTNEPPQGPSFRPKTGALAWIANSRYPRLGSPRGSDG